MEARKSQENSLTQYFSQGCKLIKTISQPLCFMAITVVLGSGGHTSELISILSSLPLPYQERIETVIYGQDDCLSVEKFKNQLHWPKEKPATFAAVPRARKVGQSFFTALFTSVWCLFEAMKIAHFSRPSLVKAPVASLLFTFADYL